MSKKKKKNEVTYYDDGSTISDMSSVGRFNERNPERRLNRQPKRISTGKEKWETYISTVKLMVLPMLGVLLVLTAICLVLLGISQCAAS